MLVRTNPPPNELKRRLAKIAEELMTLHRDLYWLAQGNDLVAQEESLGDLSVEQVMALKLAVDNVRELLWKYVDAVAKVEPERVQEAMETHRLRRVTQLLELLRERLGRYPEGQPVSFFERISAAIKDKLSGNKAA